MAAAAREPRLRSARLTLSPIGRANNLIFHNFATGIAAEGEPLTAAILHFFGNWRPVADLSCGVPGIQRGDPAPGRLSARARHPARAPARGRVAATGHDTWSSWNPAAGFFHFSTKDDFAALDDVAGAEARLKARQAGARPPRAIRIVDTRRRVALPPSARKGEFVDVLAARRTWRSFSRQPLALGDLSALAHLTFGIHAWGVTDAGRRIALKTSPSGRRHPSDRGLCSGAERARPRRRPLSLSPRRARARAHGRRRACHAGPCA